MKRILPILVIALVITFSSKGQSRISPVQEVTSIVKFYPNPATSFITFDLGKGYEKGYGIQVYNFLGKMVYEQKNVSPKTTIDLSQYNRGVYIYQLRDKDGKIIESGKFQVSK